MWVYRNHPLYATPPIILFDRKPGRTPDYPRAFFSSFSGTIVTDGYQVYNNVNNASSHLLSVEIIICFVNLLTELKPVQLSTA